MSSSRQSKTPTCTYHCRSCNSHFSSLAAFDEHRVDQKQCYIKYDDYDVTEGECRISDDKVYTNVTILALPNEVDWENI